MSLTTSIIVVFTASLACALAATPVVRDLAERLGFFDRPASRKLHRTPVPLMGGIAIYVAVVLSVVFFGHHYLSELVSILIGATLMALLGLLDDRVHLPSSVKFAVQLAVTFGLYLAGIRVALGWLPPWANVLLSLSWLVGITNAINLLDNMDGLSCGISAVAAAFFTIIGAMNGQYLVSALAAALLGACVGFLFFNTKPASIFMGDSGSLFLGLLLGVIGIKLRFPQNVNFVTWMVPVLIMGVPIFDTTLVVFSRVRRGVNPFTTAGKDHVSHRLTARGLTEREAVLVLYLAACFCGLLAMFIMQASVAEGYQMGGAVVLLALWFIWRLESLPVDPS